MRIDFGRVADHLLARSRELLEAWFPAGRFRGNEFVLGNLRGEPGESLSINWRTGLWSDFGTGEKGGDLVSLYAAIHGLSQPEAAAELCPEDDIATPRPNGHAPDPLPPPTAAPVDVTLPAPANMVGRWLYFLPPAPGPVLIVCRLPGPDGKKTFSQFTWRQAPGAAGRWVGKGYGDTRPLYRLPELLANPAARVLIVEGEKAADAAQAALGSEWVVTTWAGGANATRKSDWSPLKGRGSDDAPIVIWPDADVAGRKAAADVAGILIGLHCVIARVATEGRPEGFDAADAAPEDIPAILASAVPIKAAERLTRANSTPERGAVVEPSGRVLADGSAFVHWQSLGLDCNGNGQPHATLGNASIILTRHPDLAGKVWLDTFRGRIYHALTGGPAPWTDADALRLTAWINQTLRLPKVGLETVHRAVELAASNNQRNSVTEWLETLVWDGIERISSWLADCLGVVKTAFTMAIAKNWLVSMVARAYQPGCQADHMPVLEGNSGAGKSSALAILGGEWYRAAPQAFGSKEFLEAIQGAWLVEIPDMVGFGRREHTQVISAITTRSDVYRASYGRIAQEHPRTAIFAATSETDEYLQDSRGKRRYWPLRCTDINRQTLIGMREQLFAEARELYRGGATWHEVPRDEALREQSQREQADTWAQRIDYYGSGREFLTVAEIATAALEIPIGKQTHSDAMRIAKCLRDLGYSGKIERDGQRTEKRYRKVKTGGGC